MALLDVTDGLGEEDGEAAELLDEGFTAWEVGLEVCREELEGFFFGHGVDFEGKSLLRPDFLLGDAEDDTSTGRKVDAIVEVIEDEEPGF